MIEKEDKEKLLKEIEKSGNVYFACLKLAIDRSTYYRWKKLDPLFGKRARVAERYGRENLCDIAKQGLGIRLKEKSMDAIKYTLGHLDPQFKPKRNSNVLITHKTITPPPLPPGRTFEDILDEGEERLRERTEEVIEKYEKLGGIPPRIDGTPISNEDILRFEPYIEDYYRVKKKDELEKDI